MIGNFTWKFTSIITRHPDDLKKGALHFNFKDEQRGQAGCCLPTCDESQMSQLYRLGRLYSISVLPTEMSSKPKSRRWEIMPYKAA